MRPKKIYNFASHFQSKKGAALFGLILCLILGIAGQSFAGTLQLSTYYPAPFAVFNQLRLVPGANPPCAGVDGMMWVNASGELRMCVGGFATTPSGVWEQNNTTNKVYLTDLQSGINPNLHVGIGTTTAATKLHVLDTVSTVLRLDSSNVGGAGLEFYEGVTRRGGFHSNASYALSFTNQVATEFVRINQTGNASFGNVAPLAAPTSLNVVGNIIAQGQMLGGVQDATASTAVFYGSPVAEGGQLALDIASDHDIVFNTWVVDSNGDDLRFFRESPYQGSMSLFLDGAGNSAFGGTPIGANRLTVVGNLMVSNTGVVGGNGNVAAGRYLHVSDRATKENIKPVGGLDVILALQGVEFTWKGTEKKGIGLIAQDVEKVLPELVDTASGTDIKGVQYGNLVAPLIEAIKEQQSQIKQLKKDIETLKENRF